MRLLVLASLLLVACPATDVFIVGDGGLGFDAGPRPDATPRRDAGPGSVCGPAPTCVGGCPRPWLLATVQDLEDVECGGHVFRYSLQAAGELCVCESFLLEEDDVLPTAVGYLPGAEGAPGHVFVAAEDAISAFGPSAFRYPVSDGIGVDIFPVEDTEGVLRAAVVQRVGELDTRILFFDGPSDPIASAAAISPRDNSYSLSPRNRRWLRRSASFAASDVDAWTGDVQNNDLFVTSRTSGEIHSYFRAGLYRTVVAYDTGVFSLALAEEENGQAPIGLQCSDMEFERCRFASAVSDPFSSQGDVYAICRPYDMFAARIIHLSASGDCEVVQSADLWPRARIWRLGLALDDYWAP